MRGDIADMQPVKMALANGAAAVNDTMDPAPWHGVSRSSPNSPPG